MEEILKKFAAMYDDMEYHEWQDEDEIYGGITFGEFKIIFKHLIQTSNADTSIYQCYIDDMP